MIHTTLAAYADPHLLDKGFPMATNLSTKLSKDDKVLVSDVNPIATERFLEDAQKWAGDGSSVEVVSSAREIAERSVSRPSCNQSRPLHFPWQPCREMMNMYPINPMI